MPVAPVNVARVSQNLRAYNLLATVQSSQLGLFRVQNQLATGLKFQSSSEAPVSAAAASALDRKLASLEQIRTNVQSANATLSAGEAAMQDAINLMIEANGIAAQTAGDTLSADERASLATVVDALLRQMVAIGNRTHLDASLFSGLVGGTQPYQEVENGIQFAGDGGRRVTITETDFAQDAFTISGEEFFNSVSAGVRGVVDLDPEVTADTRVSDLRGTTGRGVRLGKIRVSDGVNAREVELAGAATVGDLLDKLNAGVPGTLVASLQENGIVISVRDGIAGMNITVSDVGANQTASDLGIATDDAGRQIVGADLDPVLTLRTPLAALQRGDGIKLTGAMTLRNGNRAASLSFDGAETLEDVLNLINQSGTGVRAAIAGDGRALEVRNLVSGAALRIEEDGGVAATSLGIRSMHAGTRLSALNRGAGVETVPGNDLRITTADGTAFEVDLDGAEALQDVLDALNAAGAGRISAALKVRGNGIQIIDRTTGGGALRIERVNNSPAIDGLGLDVRATGGQLVGGDVNPVHVESTFTALMELRDALRNDDTRALTAAGQRLDAVLEQMQEVQGRMASQARNMVDRETRIENEVSAAQVLLSDVRDVDITEAVVRFQQVQTALQANLTTSSRILSLSLIDYLR